MFIISKRNFVVPRTGREPYVIKKDYIGEIPEDVAGHWLVQAAMKDGSIAAPQSRKDTELEKAAARADEKRAETDIRPDAKKEQKPSHKEKQ